MIKLIRGLVFLVALIATVAAVLYPIDEPDAPRRAARSYVSAPSVPDRQNVVAIVDDDRVDVDPFASRGWGAEPVAAAAPATMPEVATVVVTAVAPPLSLPLPFQFVGRMNDAGDEIVYLKSGEQISLARAGETLQGTHKVLSISGSQIEFEHVATGEKQFMSLPALDAQ